MVDARAGRPRTSPRDAIIVGGGLAGLVAAAELADAGKRVVILEQEGENSLGGQAFWSLGGLFFVDSPEQRRMKIRDSHELALQDWMGSAGFDRPEDHWPRRVAEAYRRFRRRRNAVWLHADGHALVSGRRLGRARRRPCPWPRQFGAALSPDLGYRAGRARALRAAGARACRCGGLIELKFRHRASRILRTNGAVCGVAGEVLEPVHRGSRSAIRARGHRRFRDFRRHGHRDVGRHWRRFRACKEELAGRAAGPGAEDHGRRRAAPCRRAHDRRSVEAAGAATINTDRMWHYTEGVRTGIRSGRTTASASCPARPRCGSTRWASGWRRPACRASTRWRR
jgi:uncharacterized protein